MEFFYVKMATFLDVSALKHFQNIFVFLFVWLVVYATLLWTRLFGDNKFVNSLIGLLLGIFALLSPLATGIIAGVAPFLTVVFILVLLMNIASQMLGGSGADAFPALKGVMLVSIVVIIIFGIGANLRDFLNRSPEELSDLSRTSNVILHPKFLGTIFILMVSIFTIALLASRTA